MRVTFFVAVMFMFSTSYGQQSELIEENGRFNFVNSVEFELFGHGSFYSISYERLFVNQSKTKTLGQIGIAYYPESIGVIPLWIPISLNQLISFGSNHLEFGIGQIIINDELPGGNNEFKLFGSFKVGYRYQNPDGRILIKLAFTPIIDYWDKFNNKILGDKTVEFIPWGGISFGYNF